MTSTTAVSEFEGSNKVSLAIDPNTHLCRRASKMGSSREATTRCLCVRSHRPYISHLTSRSYHHHVYFSALHKSRIHHPFSCFTPGDKNHHALGTNMTRSTKKRRNTARPQSCGADAGFPRHRRVKSLCIHPLWGAGPVQSATEKKGLQFTPTKRRPRGSRSHAQSRVRCPTLSSPPCRVLRPEGSSPPPCGHCKSP